MLALAAGEQHRETRRPDQRRDDPHRKLPRIEQRPRGGVRPDQEDRADQGHQRQQGAVAHPGDQPHRVRQDQPDEPDRPAHRHHRPGEQRRRAEQRPVHPLHVDAEGGRRGVAERERVEDASAQQDRNPGDQHRGEADRHRGPACAGQGAEQPAEDFPVRVAGDAPEDDEAGDGRGERGDRQPGQHGAAGGDPAQRVRQQQGHAEGKHRTQERGERQQQRRSQQKDRDGAQRRPRGQAEQVRVGQRITGERLHHGAAHRQARADRGGGEHPRQPQFPPMPSRSRLSRPVSDPQVVQHAAPDILRCDLRRADRDGDRHGGDQHRGEHDPPQQAAPAAGPVGAPDTRSRYRDRLARGAGFGSGEWVGVAFNPDSVSPAARRGPPPRTRCALRPRWPRTEP